MCVHVRSSDRVALGRLVCVKQQIAHWYFDAIGGLKEQNSNNHSSGPAWTLTVRRTIAVCNGSSEIAGTKYFLNTRNDATITLHVI